MPIEVEKEGRDDDEARVAIVTGVDMTEDAREGPLAFAQKRKPEWKRK
jgi:1,4-dihydroxy-2-naphthoyl-CoA synthase